MEDGGGCKDNLSCSVAVEKAAELADGKIKKMESQ